VKPPSARGTLTILLVAFGLWLVGTFFVERFFPNTGYRLFVWWRLGSPTLVTLVLSARAARAEPRNVALHVAWVVTLLVVVVSGHQFWAAYVAMDDAPRGLLLDLYQVEALVAGAATYGLCRLVARAFARR
jgi:hypothetical protein